jgi:hypothetical protein
MELSGENYNISFEPESATITCRGQLRLCGEDGYTDISNLLNEIVAKKPKAITLDLRQLRFLNSSGINVFFKFVINVRNAKASRLRVQGTHAFPWHQKTLKNLKRLMPDLSLEIE